MLSAPQHARGYMPQLDALRALAVAAVAWSHWAPHEYQGGIPWGALGVKLFFVLSGFLITAILLDCRQAAADDPEAAWLPLRNFYIRRFLRLMPLYYATLLLASVCNVKPVPETLGWTLTYTTNFYFYARDGWHGVISHFWSLAVEEQFYLVWPWVILLVPLRWLRPVVAGVALASAGGWLALFLFEWRTPVSLTLPVLCCDALGLGSLLALLHDPADRSRLATWAARIGVPGWLVGEAAMRLGMEHPVLAWLHQESVLLVCLWLIERASVGFRGPLGRLLESRVLVGLGTISYGLYVLHSFAPVILRWAIRVLDLPRWPLRNLPIRIVLLALITIAVAWVSWQVLEQPIQQWKRLFPYRRPVPKPIAQAHPRRKAA